MLLIGGGVGWYFLVRPNAQSGTTPADGAVADQKVDPAPLTAAEVFGSAAIPSSLAGGGSYKVAKTQAAGDCKTAAGGDLATILATAGCTQVVRATLTSPDGVYVITTGIFNLADAAKASAAKTAIKTAIDTGKGRFSGLVAGGSTNVIAVAAANVAWQVQGHYLTYCVVAKTDGGAIAASDTRTGQVVSDVVKDYLGDTVIHKRGTSGSPALSSSKPS